MVERWFEEITNKRIRRKSWDGVVQLERGITDFVKNWNESGKKFIWTKTAEDIKRAIEKTKSGYAN